MHTDLTKYYIIRRKLDTGDLIEWRSKTLLGWLLRLRTGSNVNHSSLVVKFALEGCEQRRYVIEANARGIELRLLSRRLKAFKGGVYWSPLLRGFWGYRDEILGWSLDKLGTKYDYGSLVKQLISHVSVDSSRYFCSEFYQHAMEHACIIPHRDYAIQPGGFHKLGFLGTECVIK